MRFLAPSYLHWLWLLAVPLVLYLFKRRARQVPVSTLLFFRSLAREHREAAWLRQMKRWVSLLLTLALLGATILALARPAGVAGGAGAVVVVVDRSASMAAARGDGGEMLLDRVRDGLRRRLADLPASTVVSLIAFDARPEVLLGRSRNVRECQRLLEEVRVLPIAGEAEAAMEVALRLARMESSAEIWWGSDQRPVVVEEEGVRVRPWVVALEEPFNAGITAFQIRPVPLERGRLEGYVQVTAGEANAGTMVTRLEVKVAGRLVQLRELELAPGEVSRLILPLVGVTGQTVEVRLYSDQDDLAWDDGVVAWLPTVAPLRVVWVAENPDPYVDLAVTSMIEAGRVEVWKGTPESWRVEVEADVYLFEGWCPEVWPAERPVLLLRPPPQSEPVGITALAGKGVPWEKVRVVAADHPVLHRVAADRVALTQTARLVLPMGMESLWEAGGETVLAAGEVNQQRVVVAAFSPARSEQLALLPAFPLVLGNAIFWCGEDPALKRGLEIAKTGDWLEGGEPTEWCFWDGETMRKETVGGERWLRADRIGGWKRADGRLGLALLGSAEETHLPVAQTSGGEGNEAFGGGGLGSVGWTMAQGLIAFVLLLLVLESYLFHRRAVY